MLNPFPYLLVYGFFGPTLLRFVAAGTFFYLASKHFSNRKGAAQELTILKHSVASWAMSLYILIELAVGVGLLLGVHTQISALIGAIICLKMLVVRRDLRHVVLLSRVAYLLLGIICLSLLCMGAGAMAFDLPL